ncbi:MAG: twin-arginine translocase TatA/TatE family subunit [Oscillospiraceae bacterium]|nr:twin-arginine translocase TatA/TatE family subunit [Oscillospiraceae bacterium]
MRIGMNELLVILLIVVIVFGPTQIPKLTRMMGKSVKQFKEGLDEADREETKDAAETQSQ